MAETEEQIPQTEPETTEEPKVETSAEPEIKTEQNQTEEVQPEPEIKTEISEEESEYIRDPILDQEEMKKVYVGGITLDATEDELQAFFEEMSGGAVEDKVIIKKETDKKSHFGFVTFATSELVDDVLLKRDQLKFKDRLLDVNRAVPKSNTSPGAHDKTKKLFIANLPKQDCNSEDLMKYFLPRHPKKYGIIEEIQLIKKKDSEGNKLDENKGFGFIMVSSEDLADKMAIQHQTFEFGGRKIELKKSVPNQDGQRKRGGGRGPGRGMMHQPNDYTPYYNWQGYGGWAPYGDYGYNQGYYMGPQGGPPAGRGRGNGRYKPY